MHDFSCFLEPRLYGRFGDFDDIRIFGLKCSMQKLFVENFRPTSLIEEN